MPVYRHARTTLAVTNVTLNRYASTRRGRACGPELNLKLTESMPCISGLSSPKQFDTHSRTKVNLQRVPRLVVGPSLIFLSYRGINTYK